VVTVAALDECDVRSVDRVRARLVKSRAADRSDASPDELRAEIRSLQGQLGLLLDLLGDTQEVA
jgi:hypothetical protein